MDGNVPPPTKPAWLSDPEQSVTARNATIGQLTQEISALKDKVQAMENTVKGMAVVNWRHTTTY